jgi:small subunit ribosomal protein S10
MFLYLHCPVCLLKLLISLRLTTLFMNVNCSQLAPKQKIRIKLRSYWVPLIEDSCKKIIEAAKTTNAKTMGPVPLPTKQRVYCVLNSPHVHKDSRFHFEIRTHQRLIDICIQLPKQLIHWCNSSSLLVLMLRLSYDSVGAELFKVWCNVVLIYCSFSLWSFCCLGLKEM